MLLTSMVSICLLFPPAGAPQGLPQRPGQPMAPGERGAGDNDPAQQQIARDMAKRANEGRQKLIKNDTDKLVKLAAELKEYVDKSNENVLSMDVVKKAEEIEQLCNWNRGGSIQNQL
jgi:hypothetical protein